MSFLGLFGGDSSSSTSTTEQITNTVNTPTFANNGGVALSAGINGSGNVVDYSVTTLDAGVAKNAMDDMLNALQDALLFGSDQSKQAYKFSSQQSTDAWNFAQDSQAASLNFASKQIASANAQAVAASGSANAALQSALAFGAQQTGVALDSLSKSETKLDQAYKDAKGVLSQNIIIMAMAMGAVVLVFAIKKH